ncbi:MAG: DUF3352 domain-containing protein [Gaiellaceae bacterium MAG52_C11]|nr:DUF3352 domain-containing protein [Candidatus Gaiellasilicea maunaloa]
MRSTLIAVFALFSLAVAACGGGSTNTAGSVAGDIAGIVPASAPVLIALETDPDSDQWQQADELLGKFPGKERLLAEVRKGLAEEGIDVDEELLPAFGDETYVVVLDFENGGDNVVALTKPRDEEKLTQLLQESDDDTVTRKIDGWTAIAESETTLDRFAQAGDKLADADWFGEAQERVEEDALVTFFANGAPINDALRKSLSEDCDVSAQQGELRYAAGTMTAGADGLRMRFAAKSEGVPEGVNGESLLSEVPSGAYAYIGSPGFDTAGLGLSEQLRCAFESGGIPDVEDELGVRYEEILDLFAGGLGLYLRPAALIPEITLLLDPEDDAKSLDVLDTLAEKATDFGGKVQRTTVAGTEAREVRLGPVSILYGANDGHVAVTTARAGIEALAEGGPSLADDDAFKDATEAADMGEDDEVFAYLDLRRIVDLADDIAGFAEQDLPREVRENLEPLRSFLVWGDASDPNDVEVGAFLEIG